MHFLQRSAKCSALIVTLLNPDILQPLQSCTLLVVLVGMWAASPVGPLYRQLLSLRLVQRVIFALPRHKVRSLRLVQLRDICTPPKTQAGYIFGNLWCLVPDGAVEIRDLLIHFDCYPTNIPLESKLMYIGNWDFGLCWSAPRTAMIVKTPEAR